MRQLQAKPTPVVFVKAGAAVAPAIGQFFNDGVTDYNFSAASSTGWFAVQDAHGAVTIYEQDANAFVAGSSAFVKVWSCLSGTDSTVSGSLVYLDMIAGDIGPLAIVSFDVEKLAGLINLELSVNPITSLNGVKFPDGLQAVGFTLTNIASVIGAIFPASLQSADFSDTSLAQSSVDFILAILDANGVHNGFCDLSAGTSAAPSVAGLASKASLVAKGWSVLNN
jgi:hypothetical protein